MHPHSYRFCPHCGHSLKTERLGGQPRERCETCGFVHWGDFTVGVGGVLWHQGKILLVQRAQNPGQGMWTIPGGYVEQGERIEEAIIREIREETHLETKALSLIGVRDRPGEDGRPHDLYVIFLMCYLSGEPTSDENEIADLGFFTPDETRNMPIASLTLSMLEVAAAPLPGFEPVSGVKMIGNLSQLYRCLSWDKLG